ncbi:DUF4055 domain-containing protein [Pseudomonas fluorescens]|uniref:DUF4055 domain-containing protein n=1 Tax=Pseudomonas fluorescens TaxID=294 RepID=UPI0021D2DC5D|nr:DUF4055 domain-containing protein [Pseudomonas fluorescens]UXV21059.1 DUF4055 domain-containing protein [Pseudomonas fluorescens]
MSDDPSATLPAVDRMRAYWDVVAPLMDGTQAIRDQGEKLLPKYPAEEQDSYNQRLALSTLLPAYAETISNNTSRVFAEPLQLGDDVPEAIQTLCSDFDTCGNDLNSWSASAFEIGLGFGLCHAFIDHQPTGDVRNLAEEKALGARPYAVFVHPAQVRGWREQGGKLVMVRYAESASVPDGVFGSKTITQIRVFEPGSWKIYRKNADSGEWEIYQKGETSLKHIPWATFYTKRVGCMEAKPPLLELAHLNVKHWQSQSDQDNLLHVARVPLLFMFTDDESFRLVISSGQATRMPKDGDAKYVEHTGAAIEAGRLSLQDLVDDMRMSGAKLLQKDKQQTKTAAQANEEAAQELSPLARMSEQFSDFLAQLLQYTADYLKAPEGGHVEMRGNFDSDYAPEVSLPFLLNMANASKLSDESLFSEAQRRGVISDELDWVSEKARIEEQGPALGAI